VRENLSVSVATAPPVGVDRGEPVGYGGRNDLGRGSRRRAV